MTRTLFFSSLMTETSSFSNLPTTLADYQSGLARGDACFHDGDGAEAPGAAPILAFARSRNLRPVGGLVAQSTVGAPTQHRDYLALRDEILDGVRRARPAVVALGLHGAMMSTACDDCEGDLLGEIRKIVGAATPIVAVLDPHAHLTQARVDNASLLIFMKEYPHTDGVERLLVALALAGRMLDDGLRPRSSVVDCRLLGFFPTQRQPMRGFVDRLFEAERRQGVLSASFVHGFPWGDMAETGAKVLVYTDGDEALATSTARELHEAIWAIKDDTAPPTISVEEAVALARTRRARPLVLADVADNPGGGAPSDSTFILRGLIDAGVSDVALGLLHDPQAVRICHQVGAGGRLLLRVGGKLGPASGQPIDLDVEVVDVRMDAIMTFSGTWRFELGDTAWIHAAGVDVVLCSTRVQMYDPSGFSHIGLDPASRSTLVVKSSNHFQAAFEPLASEIRWVSTPGAIDFDFKRLAYKKLARPIYPRVADPFQVHP